MVKKYNLKEESDVTFCFDKSINAIYSKNGVLYKKQFIGDKFQKESKIGVGDTFVKLFDGKTITLDGNELLE